MRLHEYEAADLFAEAGIAVPERLLARTPGEARDAAEDIGCPVIVKAQVLVGGRGKAGGIRSADAPADAERIAAELLANDIKGVPVESVLVSRKVNIVGEYYLGITVDGYSGRPVVMVSAEGGVSIEDVAAASPEKIATIALEDNERFLPYRARDLISRIPVDSSHVSRLADIAVRLYDVFNRYDALIAEINPVAVCADGSLMAVDAVFEVDDSSLFRHRSELLSPNGRITSARERQGRDIGVTYVELDGDIGLIASGAGLGMATMDIIGKRLNPANFLETGGGITDTLLYDCMGLVLSKPGLRGVLINVYGGINPIHEGAKGVVRYMKEHAVTIPVVAKALGNRQEETWDILRSGGVHVVTDVATEKAVDLMERLLEAGTEGGAA